MAKKLPNGTMQATIYVSRQKWHDALEKLAKRGKSISRWSREQIEFVLRDDYDELQATLENEIKVRDAKKVIEDNS